MKALAQSQAARRRAAAAAIASVGAGILGTQSAEAEIVTINLASAGSPGVDITGVNAGLASGNFRSVYNFPISGNTLSVENRGGYGTGLAWGALSGGIAINSGGYYDFARPTNFLRDATIGPGADFSGNSYLTVFQKFYSLSPAFGNNSYLGFKTSQGNYGWIKATWNGSNTFQLYTAAYEATPGVAIRAGDDGSSAVPEIDPSGLASAMSLVMGSAAMLEQRRRKRAAVAAESAAVTA